MRKSNYNEASSGVRLMQLIQTRMFDIVKHEYKNGEKMCLYGTGEYWTGFEHSAYFLKKLFPRIKSFVLNHPEFPFPVVGVSVSNDDVRRYALRHGSLHKKSADYMEFHMPSFDTKDYGDWHTEEVKTFTKELGCLAHAK